MSFCSAAVIGRHPVVLKLAVLACLLACGWAPAAVQAAPGSAELAEEAGLDELVRYAMRHSPELEASYQRWRAALARVPQASALPEPQLSLGFVLDEVDRSTDYMGERYGISQLFPWFGKLSLREDIALEEARAEARRFEAAQLALAERVTQAWFEYAWIHQAAATARESRALMIHFESVARARYRVGEVSQADVNRAQVELGRLDEQLRSLLDLLGPVGAELNAVLGRPAHARLPGAPAAPSKLPLAPLPEHDDEHWLALARAQSPELAAGRHEAAREAHAIELARRDYYPDFMLGVEYDRGGSSRMARMDSGGSDMVVGMVSFSIPIRRARYDAGVQEARARHTAANRAVQSREFGLEAELKRALFAYRDGQRKAELYGTTLLPKGRQSLASTEAAYRAGEAGFSDLVDAHRVLLEFALARERAATDRAQALARVRTLVGEALVDDLPRRVSQADGEFR